VQRALSCRAQLLSKQFSMARGSVQIAFVLPCVPAGRQAQAYTGAVSANKDFYVSQNSLEDSRPVPPERPGDNECCQSGCDPCVFDFYASEMDRYRQELKAWEARQAAGEERHDRKADA
jgi:hypothetical protein